MLDRERRREEEREVERRERSLAARPHERSAGDISEYVVNHTET